MGLQPSPGSRMGDEVPCHCSADPAICLHLKEVAVLRFACNCKLTGSLLAYTNSMLSLISPSQDFFLPLQSEISR